MLVYLAYRGILCEELTGNESVPKISLRDLVTMLDVSRQDDSRYLKRNDEFLDAIPENGLSPEEFVKNNQYLWQLLSEQLSEFHGFFNRA